MIILEKKVKIEEGLIDSIDQLMPRILLKYAFLEESTIYKCKDKALEELISSPRVNTLHFVGLLTKKLDLEVKNVLKDPSKKEQHKGFLRKISWRQRK